MLPIDPELLRRQLDEQLRRNVELAYQDYLTKVRALETVVRAQGEIAAGLPPLTLQGLLAAPSAVLTLPPALQPLLALTTPAGAPPLPALPAAALPAGQAAPAPAPQAGPAAAAEAAPAAAPEPAPAAAPEPAPRTLPAPAPAAKPARKRPKAQDFEVYNAILDVLDQLGEVFDKKDLVRALGFEPRRSNLQDALHGLRQDKVIEVESYFLGNKPTRYRRVRPEPAPEPAAGE